MGAAYSTGGVNGVADGGSTTIDSSSYVVPSGAVVYVVIESSDGSPADPSGVVWDPTGVNEALTKIGATLSFGGFAKASLYRIIAPTAGTAIFRGTYSASQGERLINVWVGTGADAATPNGTVATATGTNGTPSTGAMTTTVGQRVLAMAAQVTTSGAARTFDSPTGTERAEGATSGTPYDSGASQDFAATTTSTTLQWTITSTVDGWAIFGIPLVDASSATTEQEGFRFGVDDGSESAHTWAQAQDTNDTVAVGTARLIRALVNTTGDLASTAFALRYQKNGAGGYLPVPVGSGNPTTIGAPAFNGVGAGANVTTSSGSLNVSYPSMTGATSDTALYLVVTGRRSTANTAPTVPGGWTIVDGLEGGTGTFGADAGTRRVSVYRKDTVTGSESGTISVSFGGTTSSTTYASIVRVDPPSAGYVLSQSSTTGQDTSAGTAVSIAGSASLDYDAAGDLLLVCHASPSDTGGVVNSPSLTASGSTFGSLTSQASIAVTGGNDHRHVIYSAVVTAAGSAAAPTFAYTASGTNSGNASGPAVFLRIRATLPAVTNQVYVDASANITAGGEATTARLTAPSGKSTSDFVIGRRWDDENGNDSIDITTDDYTEVEWRINTQSPAANGDYFDFRVYAGSSPLSTYTVTPRLTMGAPAEIVLPPGAEPQAVDLLSYDAFPYALDWAVNVASIASTLGAVQDLAGDAVASATAQAALQLLIGLAAAAQAQASASASLTHGVPLSATAQAAAAATGALSQAVSLAAAAAAQAGASGVLSISVPLTGAAAALSTAGGALSLTIPLEGSAAGQAAASGSLATAGQVDLSGSAAAQANAAGALSLTVSLLGAALGVAAAAGSLSKTDALTGDAMATATATGVLTASSGLVGAAVAAAAATGSLSLSVALQGAALAQASASGSLSMAIQLGGAAAAQAGATGVVSLTVPLSAAAVAIGAASGGVVVTVNLSGAAAAAAAAAGTLNVPVQLSGAAGAQASATGSLFVSSVGDFTNTAFKARAVPRAWRGRTVPRTWRARTPA